MPYAFVEDVAASWEHCRRVAQPLIESGPEGLVLHVVGPTDEGFRTIAVWESREARQRFQAETFQPAVPAFAGSYRPEPTFRDLSAAHVVCGDAARDVTVGHEVATISSEDVT